MWPYVSKMENIILKIIIYLENVDINIWWKYQLLVIRFLNTTKYQIQ